MAPRVSHYWLVGGRCWHSGWASITSGFKVFVAGGVMVVALATVAGCQEGIDIGVKNSCGEAIEVDVNGEPDAADQGYPYNWESLDSGVVATVGLISESSPVFVRVRSVGSAQVPEPVEFDPATLASVGDIDALVVIEGDLCPSAG